MNNDLRKEMNYSRPIHDLRNRLNTISMNAELGKMILQSNGDAEKAINTFNIIMETCQKSSQEISELKKLFDSINVQQQDQGKR